MHVFCLRRFETTKKKLYPLTFADFSKVSQAIMQNWTSGTYLYIASIKSLDLGLDYVREKITPTRRFMCRFEAQSSGSLN